MVYKKENMAHTVGYFLGVVLGIGIMVTLVLFVVWLISVLVRAI